MNLIMKLYKKSLFKIANIIYKNNAKKFVELEYEIKMNKKLDLNNPKSFNEKINWIKVNYYNPLYGTCSDKIEVREYIKEKKLSSILTKMYRKYDSIDDLSLDGLPNSFVIKTTHSCGGVIVVNDKSKANIKIIKKELKKSFKTDLYYSNREWQYKNIKPRIMIEELIYTKNDLLTDYKFFCFQGKVHYVYVAKGIASGDQAYCLDFYDKDFNWLNVKRIGHKNYGPIEKPKNYDKMIKIAETLSKDFSHVRVDLYNENGRIYFGELTFTTAAGFGKFDPDSFDYTLGKLWDLNYAKNYKNK